MYYLCVFQVPPGGAGERLASGVPHRFQQVAPRVPAAVLTAHYTLNYRRRLLALVRIVRKPHVGTNSFAVHTVAYSPS